MGCRFTDRQRERLAKLWEYLHIVLDRSEHAEEKLGEAPSSAVHTMAEVAYWASVAAEEGLEKGLEDYLICINAGVDSFNAEIFLQKLPPCAVIATEFLDGIPTAADFGKEIGVRIELGRRGPACIADFRAALSENPGSVAAAYRQATANHEPTYSWPDPGRRLTMHRRPGCSAPELIQKLEAAISDVTNKIDMKLVEFDA
jgi:hypothetical protein